jgi:hypothetical protein
MLQSATGYGTTSYEASYTSETSRLHQELHAGHEGRGTGYRPGESEDVPDFDVRATREQFLAAARERQGSMRFHEEREGKFLMEIEQLRRQAAELESSRRREGELRRLQEVRGGGLRGVGGGGG